MKNAMRSVDHAPEGPTQLLEQAERLLARARTQVGLFVGAGELIGDIAAWQARLDAHRGVKPVMPKPTAEENVDETPRRKAGRPRKTAIGARA